MMKYFSLILTLLLITPSIFSQTKIENIKRGYLICLGIEPNAGQINQMDKNIKPDAISLKDVLSYLNNYIYTNRETLQRDIIKRAHFTINKTPPDSLAVEMFYNSTTNRPKNYTQIINELNVYFTSDIIHPN